MDVLAISLYHTDPGNGRVMLHAMPVMLLVLVCLTLAYRYYSAFLAAKVAVLDDARITPAHRLNDGQNYHPTNKWVLFGHHFAAISGAGPLIGPVLAIQYGFMPGLLWLVIGVCLAGAVQDMLVLAASVRRDGKSLAEIARVELGLPAAIIASVAILFIVIIALAGLGIVVVKALGGEEVKLPAGMRIDLPEKGRVYLVTENDQAGREVYEFPAHCKIRYSASEKATERPEAFRLAVKPGKAEEYDRLHKFIELVVFENGKSLGAGNTISQTLVAEASRLPGVIKTTAGIVDLVDIEDSSGIPEQVVILGEPSDSFCFDRLKILNGRRLSAVDRGKVIIGDMLAENLKKKVGESIKIQNERFEIVGIYKSSVFVLDRGAILLLDDAQHIFGVSGRVSGFTMRVLISSINSDVEVKAICEKIAALHDARDPAVHLKAVPTEDPTKSLPVLGSKDKQIHDSPFVLLPPGCTQIVPGSSWGTFTIACTIPIALLVGLWMYRIRKGRVVEASIIGGCLTLAVVVAGNWIPGSALEQYFSLTREQTIFALCIYGFIAAVLPVWLLLGPRDYLSSFLKIGTVALLVVSVLIANPTLHAPPLNEVFMNGGPTFPGAIFPFVFICVMCGAISGFHSLVASGTTPKMIDKESQIRTIGYGAMLIEGLVATVALIAAASLPPDLYYDINVAIDRAPEFQSQLGEIQQKYGVSRASVPPEAQDPLHAANVDSPQHLDLSQVEEKVGGEALRGRTGGAVTLAVGMSLIFGEAFRWFGVTGDWLLKYWYHFAIMFEALFILTTIDAGTRIARFLLQETAGRVYKPLARPDFLLGSLLASGLVTIGYGWLVYTGSIETIWPMFGIANQLLAAMALALVTTWLVNNGRGRYAPVTVLPMLFVTSTTLTAGATMVRRFMQMIDKGAQMIEAGQNEAGRKVLLTGYLNAGLTLFVIVSVCTIVLWSISRWVGVWLSKTPSPPNPLSRGERGNQS